MEDTLEVYRSHMSKAKILSKNEEVVLFTRYWNDEITRDELAEKIYWSNIKFIYSVAYEYKKKSNVPLEELISAGCTGLNDAVDRYNDLTKKFFTYAVYWIKHYMGQYIEYCAHPFKISHNIMQDLRRVSRGESLADKDKEEEMKKLLESCTNPKSLDAPVTNDNDSNLIDILNDKDSERTIEEIENNSVMKYINTNIDCLNCRERYVVKAINGFYGYPMSLRQTASKLGVSYTTVSKIKEAALDKLRGLIDLEEV